MVRRVVGLQELPELRDLRLQGPLPLQVRLQRGGLEPGLNVIDAPNEGGKSTWTAFLRVMFYGLSTKDRSPNADKRRYQPWSGSAMAGVMDAATARGEVTVTRSTARANAPMGQFTAVYAGTSDSVEWLTAADCGETLLGVPQDVYERYKLRRSVETRGGRR